MNTVTIDLSKSDREEVLAQIKIAKEALQFLLGQQMRLKKFDINEKLTKSQIAFFEKSKEYRHLLENPNPTSLSIMKRVYERAVSIGKIDLDAITNSRHRMVVKAYIDGATAIDIAQSLGVSRARVHQIIGQYSK